MTKGFLPPQIVVVKSSAGSGKTYRLAQQYIAYLILDTLDGKSAKNRISGLVAITFTNKAAQEMRNRIIDWMKRIILDVPFDGSPIPALDEILANEDLCRRRKSQEAAGEDHSEAFFRKAVIGAIEKDFDDLLKSYYSFNVSTIDSFVNLILKASAFRLDLPPDFDISLDSSAMIDLVLNECLRKIAEDDAVLLAFDRFLDSYIETEGDTVTWLPKQILQNIVSALWAEESKEGKTFAYYHSRGMGDLRERIADKAKELLSSICSNPKMLPLSYFIKALDECVAFTGNMPGRSTYLQKECLDKCLKRGSAQPDSAQEGMWQDFLELRRTFVERIAASRYTPYIEIYDLFKRMLRMEVTYRKRVVLIEELNRLLRTIVEEQSFIPEIYYSLAERYVHFLIDEFQDTNHLQWQNIEILAEEAIAGSGSVFLVGDKKQAIYRWRGGDSELVDDIVRKYRKYRIDEQSLGTNYRSSGNIVTFNNELFGTENLSRLIDPLLAEHPADTKERILRTYENSSQTIRAGLENLGLVLVEQLGTSVDENGEEDLSFTKKEATRTIIARFKELIKTIRERNCFRDNEIAVLVRKKDEAALIVRTLLESGINVESELTVDARQHVLVREMMSFLRFVENPDNDLAFSSFVTGSIFLKGTEATNEEMVQFLAEERLKKHAPRLYQAFQAKYAPIWEAFFEDFLKRSGYLPLYEFIVLFLKRWSIFTHFPDEIPYFFHVLEIIKDMEGTGNCSILTLVNAFTDQNESPLTDPNRNEKSFLLKTSGTDNAVKVLTIHKAKGLEFPVVILPFLKLTSFSGSDGRNKNQFIVSEDDRLMFYDIKKDFRDISPKLKGMHQKQEADYLLDELNNIYVACTRAAKELYILLADGKGRKKNHLIDYLHSLIGFREFTKDRIISIGTPFESFPEDDKTAATEPSDGDDIMSDLIRGRLGTDIGWLDRTKTRFRSESSVSRRQIAATKRGDLIHYILSLILTLPDEYEPFVRRYVKAGAARFPRIAHEEEICRVLLRFFANPRFLAFFQPPSDTVIFTEKEVVNEKGDLFKIDRLVVGHTGVDIIDFKSGETASDNHMEQLKGYKRLIADIYPDRVIRGHILYIEEEKAVTL